MIWSIGQMEKGNEGCWYREDEQDSLDNMDVR